MNQEQPTAVDTSAESTDDRIGPDGKITEDQGEYLKAKAINNVSESIVKRATDLGGIGAIVDGGNVAHFRVHDENNAGVTGLVTNRLDDETGRDINTITTINAPGEPSENTTVLRRTTSKDDIHRETYVDHVDNDGTFNGKIDGSAFNESRSEHRGLSSQEAARTAIEVLNEQRGVLAAAKRVVNADNEPDKVA